MCIPPWWVHHTLSGIRRRNGWNWGRFPRTGCAYGRFVIRWTCAEWCRHRRMHTCADSDDFFGFQRGGPRSFDLAWDRFRWVLCTGSYLAIHMKVSKSLTPRHSNALVGCNWYLWTTRNEVRARPKCERMADMERFTDSMIRTGWKCTGEQLERYCGKYGYYARLSAQGCPSRLSLYNRIVWRRKLAKLRETSLGKGGIHFGDSVALPQECRSDILQWDLYMRGGVLCMDENALGVYTICVDHGSKPDPK